MRRLFAAVLIAAAAPAIADDWPEWRGSNRDAIWREAGMPKEAPSGDVQPTWSTPANLGYAGPAVADGKVYLFEYERSEGSITDNPGARDNLEGVERLRCLDSATGRELWRYEYERPYFISYPSGPRCTPTVDGDRVYALGAEGDLTCLDTAEGTVVWKKNFKEAYAAPTPQWGHSAHPLVDGDFLYCLVGGEGSVVVAFDKRTGEEKWKALSTPSINNECGYCPPTMIEQDGERVLAAFHPEGVTALTRDEGKVLWSVPIDSSYGMSIAQPVQVKDLLFVTGYTGDGGASVLLKLPTGGGEPEVVWSGGPKRSISAANSTPVPAAEADVIYGVDANDSVLAAVDMASGERLWQTREPTLAADAGRRARHGTCFLVRQANTDRFWIASESGDLILASLTPDKYQELSRFKIVEPTGDAFGRPVWWSHPAFAEGAVFARNDKEIVRVDLATE
ncbi:PQQ-binding-like beta-propeller repeat protein [Botrimarina sp.]|uniref:PQQ-binding-like beta-propeller repeat protein n=1 Tax=Botrimarina sp. TaxID=2795802 RepID=UPI0032EE38BD